MVFPGSYAIAVGILMMGQWAFFLGTNQVPELRTAPLAILFHLSAEFLTAIALLTGGFALLKGMTWGRRVYPVAMGMLLYTLVASPGYFAQRQSWALVSMFAVLFALALASLSLFFSRAKG